MTSRLLVDNFFSPRIYSGHTLSSNENSDNTALVGAARRSTHDAWSPTTANNDAWNKSRNDVPRAADMIVIDRGHNLLGETVKVQDAADDFATTPEEPFNGTLPTYSGAGALTDAFGVVTPEGAWLKRFDTRWNYDWRAYYVAMGAGLVPLIPGLWIGLSWSPGDPWRPHAPGMSELIVEETQSDQGWTGRGKATKRKQGVLHFKFATLFDAEEGDWHIQQIAAGRPFWVVPDEARGDLAFLAVIPKGMIGTVLEPQYFYPALDLPYIEWNPQP